LDNVKRSGSETEIKDLSEDLDLEKNDDVTNEDTSDNQENEE
jgi:hypothetical protein